MPFGKTVAKREKCDSELIIYHDNFHSRLRVKSDWDQDHFYVLSIDPGIIHLGIRLSMRIKDPTSSDETGLKFKEIKTIQMNLHMLAPHKGEKINIILSNLDKLLDYYYYTYCLWRLHIVLIERQITANYKPTRIMQHTITYFVRSLKDKPFLPVIIEYDAKLKGLMLKAPRGLSERDLKLWSILEGKRIMVERKDWKALQIIKDAEDIRKGDDVTDTIVQEEALFASWGCDTSHLPIPIKELCCDDCQCSICKIKKISVKNLREMSRQSFSIPTASAPSIPNAISVFNINQISYFSL